MQGLCPDSLGTVGDAIPYNLPGLNCVAAPDRADPREHLPREDTKWNDAAITKVNPKCTMPDTKITPVYRSDNSGTSYNFTDYLSSVNGSGRRSSAPASTSSGRQVTAASGSSGVAGVISKTEGSVGYVDVAYALTNKLRFASILNASGKYTTPGLRGIAAAAATLPKKLSGDGEFSIVNPPKGNPLAYPISTFTYVISPTNSSKSAELRKMIYWAVTRGQTFGKPLLFQPLPLQVQAFAFKQIKQINTST